jgi:hypothetical protein
MLAHGFTIEQMVELVRAGLASVSAERVVAGRTTVEIAWVRITEAGRRSLGEGHKALLAPLDAEWHPLGGKRQIMTIQELNDLIARGAAQPGIREVEEMMRLCWAFNEQARDLAALYAAGPVFTVASGTDAGSILSAAPSHANLG